MQFNRSQMIKFAREWYYVVLAGLIHSRAFAHQVYQFESIFDCPYKFQQYFSGDSTPTYGQPSVQFMAVEFSACRYFYLPTLQIFHIQKARGFPLPYGSDHFGSLYIRCCRMLLRSTKTFIRDFSKVISITSCLMLVTNVGVYIILYDSSLWLKINSRRVLTSSVDFPASPDLIIRRPKRNGGIFLSQNFTSLTTASHMGLLGPYLPAEFSPRLPMKLKTRSPVRNSKRHIHLKFRVRMIQVLNFSYASLCRSRIYHRLLNRHYFNKA